MAASNGPPPPSRGSAAAAAALQHVSAELERGVHKRAPFKEAYLELLQHPMALCGEGGAQQRNAASISMGADEVHARVEVRLRVAVSMSAWLCV